MAVKKTNAAAPAKPKPIKIPKTIGACADRLYAIKEEASKIKKLVEELDKERKAIQEHVINELPKSNAKGVTGSIANVRVVTKEVPQVKDWDAFYGYVRKTKRTDLLQRRLSDGAIGELMDSGIKVPGVESFTAVSISLTKA